ncbi:6657_t:CDS:1, partial [Gigaspora rosea]
NGFFDKIISVSGIEGDAALDSNIKAFGSSNVDDELAFVSNDGSLYKV